MENRKKPKNKKFIIQVLAAMVPVIVIMTAVILYLVYHSTVNGFLEAQNTRMTDKLNGSSVKYFFNGLIDDETEWYLEYFEAHPEVMTEPVTEQEEAAVMSEYGETSSVIWELEKVRSADETVKSYCAKRFYGMILSTADQELNDFDCIFMALTDPGYEGRLIYRIDKDDSETSGAWEKGFELSEHSSLEELISSGSTEVLFERTRDFMLEGDYYVGYKAMTLNEKTRAVLGVAYNWSSFSEVMSSTFKKAFISGFAAVLVVSAVLVTVLYLRGIRPAAKLKQGVSQYMEDKNSSTVQSRMAEVKTRNEIGALAEMFSDLSVEIDNYIDENIRLVEEKKRIDTELELAKNIQSTQLPSTFPAFPDRKEFDIYASMTPAREVGGDFYDFFLVDEDHLALVIADVSGKGVSAALLMMQAMVLINNFAMSGMSPKDVFEKTNRALCRNNEQGMFVTAWLGILEISTGKITASNAGHECPIIRQPDGQFEVLREKHDFILGAFARKKYKESVMTLKKGGTLLVYTDGVPEATDSDEKMFGLERLTAVLNRTPDAAPQQLLTSVHEAVNEFTGEAEQFDDLTMLGIKLL